MNVIKNKYPFPHVICEDYYTKDELFEIWKELEFLSYVQKLEPPEKTGGASYPNHQNKKNNLGVWLDTLYSKREISNILTINRKIYSEDLVKEISSFDFCFHSYEYCKCDATIIHYYENSQYYKSHRDRASYTSLTWLYKDPKMFKGGDLYFTEYDYECLIENNKMIFFPSFVEHQVSDILMPSTDIGKYGNLSTNGRYCITQFIHYN